MLVIANPVELSVCSTACMMEFPSLNVLGVKITTSALLSACAMMGTHKFRLHTNR